MAAVGPLTAVHDTAYRSILMDRSSVCAGVDAAFSTRMAHLEGLRLRMTRESRAGIQQQRS